MGRRSASPFANISINPKLFIKKGTATLEAPAEWDFAHETFAEFPLSADLQQAIRNRGYTKPTPIQDACICPVLDGENLVGLASTGTGKTAAFCLPLINRIVTTEHDASVLVVSPTRELAQQIVEEIELFSEGLGIRTALCVGGLDIGPQLKHLAKHPHFIVGTPGRLKDLILNFDAIHLRHTETVVLDEFDRMLDMGFIDDARFLLSRLPKQRQSLFFSATMTKDIERILGQFVTDPIIISVNTERTPETIDQDVIEALTRAEKFDKLVELLTTSDPTDKFLIFGQTKTGVQSLADDLARRGIAVEAIHGDRTQAQRQKVLSLFKSGSLKVLVATDVAARGLDIPDVSHVVNYDQPQTYEEYIHRIGRTGRAGKVGKALTFVPYLPKKSSSFSGAY